MKKKQYLLPKISVISIESLPLLATNSGEGLPVYNKKDGKPTGEDSGKYDDDGYYIGDTY